MTDTIKKYLKKTFHSEEELDAALEECGVPKRVQYQADIVKTVKKYTVLETLGYYGGLHGFVFEAEKCNKILGVDLLSSKDRISSFFVNVILDVLIKQQEAKV